ncbi:MAG: YcgN family cysteine cluster protein [Dongiaceae bacterium]
MAGSRGRARQAAPPEEAPFWRTTPLAEMTPAQWESLCDGCGRCCLIKLEYEDTGEIDWTNIACRQLDPETCKCRNYALRRTLVEDCLSLTPAMIDRLAWLPATCGYRLVAEGRDLQWWHPLVSGSAETVHQAGISVRRKVIGEDEAGPPEDHVVDWLE